MLLTRASKIVYRQHRPAADINRPAPFPWSLFSVRAQEYAAVGYLQAKLVLVLVGLLSALMIHRAYGLTLEGASQSRLRFHALFSLGCWLGALARGLSR
jgi:hypothetical protein